MERTRRHLIASIGGFVGTGVTAGCLDDGGVGGTQSTGTPSAQASFFVFGDLLRRVADGAATTGTLVPVGQHGHGWEPGPSVRQDIRDAELLVHGREGFQPWIDDVLQDLEADDVDVETTDITSGVDMLAVDDEHSHDGDDHDDDHSEENHDDHSQEDHDAVQGVVDPHFWMDPLRVKDAVGTVERALVDVDPDGEDTYAENAETLRSDLDDLHERIESTVAAGTNDVVLVAGHGAFGYLEERYDLTIEALSGLTPDDRPTPRDTDRAQQIVETHDLSYVCADPLEPQTAAEAIVAETDAEAVLPLTAMPGLTEEWDENGWGYLEIMENVNLPTLERALET